ncbi:MAG: hypothetical protein MZV63_07050 [Marinilabiliales bacterium]|nr:hypothetical protein [Marinilabiliales bacterium]
MTFPQQVAQLIEEFGHLSDNGNDFSAVPWREQPGDSPATGHRTLSPKEEEEESRCLT